MLILILSSSNISICETDNTCRRACAEHDQLHHEDIPLQRRARSSRQQRGAHWKTRSACLLAPAIAALLPGPLCSLPPDCGTAGAGKDVVITVPCGTLISERVHEEPNYGPFNPFDDECADSEEEHEVSSHSL